MGTEKRIWWRPDRRFWKDLRLLRKETGYVHQVVHQPGAYIIWYMRL